LKKSEYINKTSDIVEDYVEDIAEILGETHIL
jgi:hypothetical protein